MIFPLANANLAVRSLIIDICDLFSLLVFVYVLLDLARNFSRGGLPPFVISLHQGLARLFEPIFRPIRNALPDLGGLDFSPLIVLLAVQFIARLAA